MPTTESFFVGEICVRCNVGLYRPASTAAGSFTEKAGVKRLTVVAGYVFVGMATVLILVGLIDLLGIGLGGAFPLFFPGAMLGALAALMIQWGRNQAISPPPDLVCDQCGLAPPE